MKLGLEILICIFISFLLSTGAVANEDSESYEDQTENVVESEDSSNVIYNDEIPNDEEVYDDSGHEDEDKGDE